jgi:stage V sporulation protein G
MKITEVRVAKVDLHPVKAFASVTFDDVFVVHSLRVIEGSNGLFVRMPNRKTKDGEFKDIAHPITREFKDVIEKAVMDEYNSK